MYTTVMQRTEPTKVRISAAILQRYTGLSEIEPTEWLLYFPNTGKPWKQRDLQYLLEWWGRDDVLSLAYALGRPAVGAPTRDIQDAQAGRQDCLSARGEVA